LELQRPKKEESDLRGFEWQYLARLSHSDLPILKGHIGPVLSVAYSPDGKRLATASGDTVKIWDAQTGKEIVSIPWFAEGFSPGVLGVAFSPDGNRLAGARPGSKGEVKIWDAQTGQELLSIEKQFPPSQAVAFSPDGARVAASGSRGPHVWDGKTGEKLLTLQGHSGPC